MFTKDSLFSFIIQYNSLYEYKTNIGICWEIRKHDFVYLLVLNKTKDCDNINNAIATRQEPLQNLG